MTAAGQSPFPHKDEPAPQPSVSDWTAGWEAGWTAGYRAAITALDDAAAHLAALRPSRAIEVAENRRKARTRRSSIRHLRQPDDYTDPTAVAAHRAAVAASWGLPAPTETCQTETCRTEAAPPEVAQTDCTATQLTPTRQPTDQEDAR